MKGIFLLIAVFLFIPYAHAISITSCEYHSWGDIRYHDKIDGIYYEDSYDSTMDAIQSWGYKDDTLNAESTKNNFGLSTYAEACGINGASNVANAYAECEWTFRPSNIFNLTINYYSDFDPYTAFGIRIIDQTGGKVLGNFSGGLMAGEFSMPEFYKYYDSSIVLGNYWDGDLTFLLSPDCEYSLYLWSWANANNDSESMIIETNISHISPVPEPATMFLLGTGLLILGGLGGYVKA